MTSAAQQFLKRSLQTVPQQIFREGKTDSVVPLAITAYGHGCRQMCLMDRYGFPRTSPKEKHPKHGFKTGDIVKAVVPAHLKRAGRMSAKAGGAFTIATGSRTVTDIGKNYCERLQRADGYGYCCLRTAFFPPTHPIKGGWEERFLWKSNGQIANL